MNTIGVSCVIPALNEERAIGKTVTDLRKTLTSAGVKDFEVIVVDDGSSDRTGEVARDCNARIVRNLQCSGYGRALKKGIAEASFDTIVIIDADQTYPVEAIPALLDKFRLGYSMVVAARQGAHYRESLLKQPLRWVLRQLVEFTAGCKIPDINSGLRVFSRTEVMGYFPHLCNTFSFTTSLTLAYLLTGKFVHYMPIDYAPRIGSSKVRLFRDSLRTLQYIVQAILYYNPIKIFLVLCGIILAVSASLFFGGVIFSIRSSVLLGIGGALMAVVVFSLGLLAELLKQIMDGRT